MQEIRFNQPSTQPNPSVVPKHSNEPEVVFPTSQPQKPSGRKKYKYFVVSFGLVIFLLLAVFASRWIFSSSVFNRYFESGSNISPYYAAFLSNGQVYFGKLLKYDRKELVLSEVYYLRLDETEPQGLAQGQNPNQQGIPGGVEEPQFSLVKLGSEIHGPTDNLFINPDYLMFFEQLRNDSRVVQSINQSP